MGCRKTAEAKRISGVVDYDEILKRNGFRGSPTILMDGRDPFPGAAPTSALSCRLYPTPDGLSGSPTVAQLRAALQNVAA